MNKFDKLTSVVLLGLLAPVTLMLLLWWGSIPFLAEHEDIVGLMALCGFASGVILDLTLLRKFIFRLYELSMPVLVGIEIFYTIMIYGFFMGFPVFNSFVGIVGCYIIARGGMLRKKNREEVKNGIAAMNRISLVILLTLCITTAILALGESSICSQVKAMLNLPFSVTMQMIWTIILVGGSSLLALQVVGSRLITNWMMKKG